jgi:hypothetical protein
MGVTPERKKGRFYIAARINETINIDYTITYNTFAKPLCLHRNFNAAVKRARAQRLF